MPVGTTGLQLRRIPTVAERLIAAPRSAVWAAIDSHDEVAGRSILQIAGSPASGVGARHLYVGPPLPPFGMRTVMYTEVTGVQESWWISFQTLAGAWEQTETWVLADAPGAQTLARINGWWSKPAVAEADFTAEQNKLNELARNALEHLARRVRDAVEVDGAGEAG